MTERHDKRIFGMHGPDYLITRAISLIDRYSRVARLAIAVKRA
jgi:hypothetical protein